MDFFEHQSQAKANSVKLYFLFSLVVVLISFLIFCLLSWFIGEDKDLKDLAWSPTFLLITSFSVFILIICVSISKIRELAGGGWVVANRLGGRLITIHTQNPLKRRILNIVEEMAIASGMPVPPVYLLEESSINAFAAGFSTEDAVIGVTTGCLEKLTREQLQGVMAHEFSHILNGDIRISIRMTGVLFGVVCIARVGRYIMDSCEEKDYSRKKDEDKSRFYILGVGLFVIGLVGGYLGAIIRSAVSRQREYLADASAVQFTRNSSGIAGALERIGGFSKGSRIWNPRSREFCHMFFGPCMKNLLATHPPLVKRIKRIKPDWTYSFPNTNKLSEGKVREGRYSDSGQISSFTTHTSQTKYSSPKKIEKTKVDVSSKRNNLIRAKEILKKIPKDLKTQSEDPYGASCIIFALLLSNNQTIRNRQTEKISRYSNINISQHTINTRSHLELLSCEEKFVLIEKSSSQLIQFTPDQFEVFESIMKMLIKEDNKLQLFEWSLSKVVQNKIKHLKKPERSIHGRLKIPSRLTECSLILGTLAHFGQESENPNLAFKKGFKHLTSLRNRKLPNKEDCTFSKLDLALGRLGKLNPFAKKTLLEACEYTIYHDDKITDMEIQIFRGVASALGCPIGPLIKFT